MYSFEIPWQKEAKARLWCYKQFGNRNENTWFWEHDDNFLNIKIKFNDLENATMFALRWGIHV